MVIHKYELKILNLIDDRLIHLRILRKNQLNEWFNDSLKWFNDAIKQQETDASGCVYIGWISVHTEMFTLCIFIEHNVRIKDT